MQFNGNAEIDNIKWRLELTSKPGIVGYIGTLMGEHGVNIANMSLSRDIKGGHALTVLNLDSAPTPDALAELRADPDISNVQVIRL